jgi:hypothetical protein
MEDSMDWALMTWGFLISIVALLWIMVMASVQDKTTDANGSSDEVAGESGSGRQHFERQTAA